MKINSFFKNLLFVSLTIITCNLSAANIYVNNAGSMDGSEIYCTNPGVDVGATSSPSSPFATLKYAISKASPGDVIFVDAGSYKEKNININISDLTITGAGPLVTKFSPASPGISGVYFMKIIGASPAVTIKNIIIENIFISGYNNVTLSEGEAVTLNNVKNIQFNYCTFGKSAGGVGEAVIEVLSNSTGVAFYHMGFVCQTQGTAGGGIEIGGTNIDVKIDSSVIGSNDRTGGMSWTRGAGLYMHGDATVQVNISNSSIINNTAQIGGGIYVSGGILTMDKCCISGNSAVTNTADFGGGITFTGTSGLCTISDCDFSSNSIASSKGGGIGAYSLDSKIDLALISCNFSGNSASANNGTDLYTKQVFGKVVNVTATNCTFGSASKSIVVASGNVTLNNCGAYTSTGVVGGDVLARTTVTKTNCPVFNLCEPPCDPIDSIGGKTKICNAKTTLTVYGNPQATFYWYTDVSTVTLFHIGKTYTTSLLKKDTSFYVVSSLGGKSCGKVVTITQDCKCDTRITKDTTICVGTFFQLKAWTDSTKTIASTPNAINPWMSSLPLVASVTNTGLVTALKAGKTVITYTDNNNCIKTDTITVLAKPVGGTATPDEDTICENTSATIRLNGYVGNIQWQESNDGVTNWKNILNATITPYITKSLTKGTYYYRALVSSGLCGQKDSSNVVVITVSPTSVAGIPLANPDTICAGNTSLLTLKGYTGKIQWQESADGLGGWKKIVGATGDTTNSCKTAKLYTTTFYRANVASGACPSVQSGVVRVFVNPVLRDSIDIQSDQVEIMKRKQFFEVNVCPDSKVTYTATTFNTGCASISYQWKNGNKIIAGATKSTYTKVAIQSDSIYCVMTVNGNCCLMFPTFNSDTIKTNVIQNNWSVSACKSPSACGVCDGEICVSGTGTGDVSWDGVSSGKHSGVTLTIPGTEKIQGLCKGTYKITLEVNGCPFSKSVTLTDPNAPEDPVITYKNDSICEGTSVTLKATGVTPSVTLSYTWYKDGVVIVGQNTDSLVVNAILTIAGKNESHKYAVKANDNGCTSNLDSVIITFVATPAKPTIISTTQNFCKSDKKTVSDLTNLITNTSGTINWFDKSIGGSVSGQSDILTTRSYYAEQVVGLCKSSTRLKVDVTIIDVAIPTLPGNVKHPTCDTATGSVSIDLPGAGIWDVVATPLVGNPKTVKTTKLTITPFTYIYFGLVPGTYTFMCKDTNGCASPITTNVIINPQPKLPAKPIINPDSIYCASNSYQLVDIDFKPKAIGTVKYYNALGDSIPGSTLVLPNTHYQFSFFNGTCNSKKLDTVISMNAGPTLKTLDLTNEIFCAYDKPTFNSFINKIPGQIAGYNFVFSPNKTGNPIIPNATVIGAVDSLVHKIYYNIIDSNKCQNKKFDSLTYKINLGPSDLKMKTSISLCAFNKPTVKDLNSAKIIGTGTLKWYDSMDGVVELPSNKSLVSGTYFASSKGASGCESVTRWAVIVSIESFGQTTLDPTNEYTFCKNSNKKISDLSISPYNASNLVWLDANKVQLGPNTILIPGTYYAAEKKGACISDKAQEIEVIFSSPVISINPVKLPTCNIGNGVLTITGANSSYKYAWYKDGVSLNMNTAILSGLADDKNSKYSVLVTDLKGCVTSDTASFTDCEPSKPPHIITPDGDGKNDKFILNYAGKYPKCKLLIYNRWGSLVYESMIPYTDSWDGKANVSDALGNDVLPAATYFYLIDKGDGNDFESGFVELVK
jgi:gliding motility-associated-like protein